MDKLIDNETSLGDMVDGFFSYKMNRYKNKIDIAMKKMRGQVVCDSDIIMADLLEPQYFINSLQDKLISQHSYIIEPFRSTYALRELKNAIVDKFSIGSDFS